MARGHCLNQCWNVFNSNRGNKLQWNLKRNKYIFIQENAFENVVCEMAGILFRPQCLNVESGYSKIKICPSTECHKVSADLVRHFENCDLTSKSSTATLCSSLQWSHMIAMASQNTCKLTVCSAACTKKIIKALYHRLHVAGEFHPERYSMWKAYPWHDQKNSQQWEGRSSF